MTHIDAHGVPHTYPPPVSPEALRRAAEDAHGLLLHLEHVAELAHHTAEQVLAHDAAAGLSRVLWDAGAA
jgi:hypothetical protein